MNPQNPREGCAINCAVPSRGARLKRLFIEGNTRPLSREREEKPFAGGDKPPHADRHDGRSGHANARLFAPAREPPT